MTITIVALIRRPAVLQTTGPEVPSLPLSHSICIPVVAAKPEANRLLAMPL
jgi:hypothetical protein